MASRCFGVSPPNATFVRSYCGVTSIGWRADARRLPQNGQKRETAPGRLRPAHSSGYLGKSGFYQFSLSERSLPVSDTYRYNEVLIHSDFRTLVDNFPYSSGHLWVRSFGNPNLFAKAVKIGELLPTAKHTYWLGAEVRENIYR